MAWGRMWPKFLLIQALMYTIATCKYDKDPIKTAEKKWQHPFPHYPIISIWGFFLTLKGSFLRSRWSNLVEFRTPPSSHACHCYLQDKKGSDEKQPRKSSNTVFLIITLSKLSFAMETRVLIRSGPKPYAAFPPPQ